MSHWLHPAEGDSEYLRNTDSLRQGYAFYNPEDNQILRRTWVNIRYLLPKFGCLILSAEKCYWCLHVSLMEQQFIITHRKTFITVPYSHLSALNDTDNTPVSDSCIKQTTFYNDLQFHMDAYDRRSNVVKKYFRYCYHIWSGQRTFRTTHVYREAHQVSVT
jgi:hypothetical protein